MILEVFTDGGSRGNPGISGVGIVIKSSHQILCQQAKYLGIKTNNEAEYQALILALEWIRDNSASVEKIIFYADSELLVRQILGVYRVKATHLQPLYSRVISLLSEINLPYEFQSIPREKNSLADSLANLAMDRRS